MAGGVLQWRMILNLAALCLCPWVGGRGNEPSAIEGADLGFPRISVLSQDHFCAFPGPSCRKRSLARTGSADASLPPWVLGCDRGGACVLSDGLGREERDFRRADRQLASTRLAMCLRGGGLGFESSGGSNRIQEVRVIHKSMSLKGGGTEPLACTVEDDKVSFLFN